MGPRYSLESASSLCFCKTLAERWPPRLSFPLFLEFDIVEWFRNIGLLGQDQTEPEPPSTHSGDSSLGPSHGPDTISLTPPEAGTLPYRTVLGEVGKPFVRPVVEAGPRASLPAGTSSVCAHLPHTTGELPPGGQRVQGRRGGAILARLPLPTAPLPRESPKA